MKTKTKKIGIITGAVMLAFFAGRILAPSSSHSAHEHVEKAGSSGPTIWTCSMHPQIRQSGPGECPICGMDLVPVEHTNADSGPRVMSMSEGSRALADIQTTVVKQEYPEAEIRLVGKLDYDETREKSLTARFPARLDKLYVNYNGIRVNAGEHLASVYSPELLTAQRELISSYRSDPNSSITRAAREKLRLWDLLPEQIAAIISSGEAQNHFVMKAPVGGLVVEKYVKEGDYIQTGQPLFRIVDLSELWLYLDAYESDLPWLRYGQDVAFTVEAFPGETFHGKIAFIEPEVDRNTRTSSIRVNVPNEENRLKPGMFARGIVKAKLGSNGHVFAPEMAGKWISPMHPEIIKDHPGECDVCGMALVPAESLGYVQLENKKAPLVVPASAVLRTGKRAVVYVELPDHENPTFEGREVVLGPRAGDTFIVDSGLKVGERVVTHGAFKIDSALQIQAKPSMMNPEGGGPVPGHKHSGHTENTEQVDHMLHQGMSMLDIPSDLVSQLIEPYLQLQSALADDDLNAAKASAKAMMKMTGHSGAFPELLHAMLDAEDLDGIRLPYFETLSNALIAAGKAKPSSFSGDILLMHCPMANDHKGADWLQRSKPLRNPYYGAAMLKCGKVKETIK